jgi:hypothetical protein
MLSLPDHGGGQARTKNYKMWRGIRERGNGTEQLEDMCESSVLRLTGDGIAADKKLLHMMPNSSQRWEVIVSTADNKKYLPIKIPQ